MPVLAVKRIVPSKGCDMYLIMTEEKAALLDTGMFHCADTTVKLIKEALGRRTLDLVILSHTHYDHVGGVPAIRKEFPGIKVYASDYGAYVLQRPGARKVMRQLSQDALKAYAGKDAELSDYDEEALFADGVIREGDRVDLGSGKLIVYETPGHTKCCLTLFEPEEGVLFLSESTGVYVDPAWVDMSILSGYAETMASIKKCSVLPAETLYISHYGKIEDISPADYFFLAEQCSQTFKNLVLELLSDGCSDEEIIKVCQRKIWETKVVGHEDQPLAAFEVNTKAFIQLLRKEFLNQA